MGIKEMGKMGKGKGNCRGGIVAEEGVGVCSSQVLARGLVAWGNGLLAEIKLCTADLVRATLDCIPRILWVRERGGNDPTLRFNVPSRFPANTTNVCG